MTIRRRRPLLMLITGLLVTCGLFAGVSLGTAKPASAAPEITICLTNAPQFCADVQNGDNASGTPIWLYRPQDGATDYHWLEVPVPCGLSGCIPACTVANCISFEDAQDPGLCLAASQSQGAELISCEIPIGGTARALWIQNGTHLRNVFWNAEDLTVSGPLYDKRYLYEALTTGSGGNEWQQWTGP
jgi:hypothetical protein